LAAPDAGGAIQNEDQDALTGLDETILPLPINGNGNLTNGNLTNGNLTNGNLTNGNLPRLNQEFELADLAAPGGGFGDQNAQEGLFNLAVGNLPAPTINGNGNLNDELLEFAQGFAAATGVFAPATGVLAPAVLDGDDISELDLDNDAPPTVDGNDDEIDDLLRQFADFDFAAPGGGDGNQDDEYNIGPDQAGPPLPFMNGNGNHINDALQFAQRFDAGNAAADGNQSDDEDSLIDLDLANVPLPTINENVNHNTQFTQEFEAASAAVLNGAGANQNGGAVVNGGAMLNGGGQGPIDLDVVNVPLPDLDGDENGNFPVGPLPTAAYVEDLSWEEFIRLVFEP
jgi:hypothetical protein